MNARRGPRRPRLTGGEIDLLIDAAEHVLAGEWPFGVGEPEADEAQIGRDQEALRSASEKLKMRRARAARKGG